MKFIAQSLKDFRVEGLGIRWSLPFLSPLIIKILAVTPNSCYSLTTPSSHSQCQTHAYSSETPSQVRGNVLQK